MAGKILKFETGAEIVKDESAYTGGGSGGGPTDMEELKTRVASLEHKIDELPSRKQLYAATGILITVLLGFIAFVVDFRQDTRTDRGISAAQNQKFFEHLVGIKDSLNDARTGQALTQKDVSIIQKDLSDIQKDVRILRGAAEQSSSQ